MKEWYINFFGNMSNLVFYRKNNNFKENTFFLYFALFSVTQWVFFLYWKFKFKMSAAKVKKWNIKVEISCFKVKVIV